MEKLSEEQELQTQERTIAPAKIVHEVIVREGTEELDRTPAGLAWSGFAAGFSIGLSLITEGVLYASLPDASWRPLIVALGYPVGFIALIMGRQQLFTENTLRAVVPLLVKPSRKTFNKVARLWAVVLAANIFGAWLFSFLIARTDVFGADIHHAFQSLSLPSMTGDFGTIFMKGIFAGWIIALMSWMLSSAVHGKVLIIFIMTYIIGLAQFNHVVAGSVDMLYLVWAGTASYGDFLFKFLLPTGLGNIVGGVLLVSIVNHAQVVAGHLTAPNKEKSIFNRAFKTLWRPHTRQKKPVS